MLPNNQRLTRDALFEDFEKDNTSKAIDNFESALIAAYERALESGLAPGAALAAMLDWISRFACADRATGVEKSASAQSLTRCLIVGPTANWAVSTIVLQCFGRPKTELSMGRIGIFYSPD